MIIGGQAVLLYGEPRLTRDVDVTLGAGPERLPDLLAIASECGWKVLPEDAAKFVAETFVLPCHDPSSDLRLDFIFSFSPFERQAIERAREVRVGESAVRFASPEDVVILKIVAGRARDLEDARSILAKNPSLDLGYVRRWLSQIDDALTGALLERFDGLRQG
jgi:predicted nucleotidyltransferase